MSWLKGLFSGWFAFLTPYSALFKIVGLILLAASIFFAGWLVNGWRLGEKLAKMETAQVQTALNAEKLAAEDLYKAATNIHNAALEFNSSKLAVGNKLDSLRKDIREYANQNKLPPDCKPDDVRMRSLSDSINEANKALSGK